MIRTRVVRGVVVLSVGFVAACGGSPESEPSADEAAVDTVSTDTAAQQASAPREDATPADDAEEVGGAAAAGAILGRVIGGDRTGTAVGAAVGAAAGTAVVLVTKRGYAVLPAGSNLILELTDPLTVEVPAQTDGETP